MRKKLLNNNLEFHVSIHSWQKPHQCSECNKIFKTKVGTYMPVLNTLREKKTFRMQSRFNALTKKYVNTI